MDAAKKTFLQSGGEMAELTRQFDWTTTALGATEGWSHSLRTLLRMMLTSRFPMLIFWGPDLITFYNDAFRPSLGNNGKHPSSLGQKGEESWAESWPVIGPMIKGIMAGGDAVWFEDQKLPIYRDGSMGFAYWTYSFSPLTDDDGSVNGVLVTCAETTTAVQQKEKLVESEFRFQNLLRQATVGLIVLSGDNLTVTLVNEAYAQVVGHTVESLIDRPIFETLPGAEADFRPLIEQVMATGQPVFLNNAPYHVTDTNGRRKDGFLNLVYQPYREEDGHITGVMLVVTEVTEQVAAIQLLAEKEAQVRTLVEESPVATCLLTGRDMQVTLVNQKMTAAWGKGEEIVGRPLAEVLPEMEGQPFLQILDEVFTSGKTFEGKEAPATHLVNGQLITTYYDFIYKPLRNTQGDVYGVMVSSIDVTERFLSAQKIETSRRELLSLFEQSPVALATIVRENLTFTTANRFYGELVGRQPEDIIGKPLLKALPEIAGQGFDDLLNGVLNTGIPFIAPEVSVDLKREGKLETVYVNLAYQPMRDEGGSVNAILVVATDVTPQVISRRQIEESEARLRGVIAAAPAGIGLFIGRDLVIENPNQTFIDIVGKGPGVEGLPLREAMPELIAEGQPFLNILDDVFTTGVPFYSPASLVRIVQNGVLKDNYYNISYTPLRNAAGEIYGILDIAIDVTELVTAQQSLKEKTEALEESQSRFRSLIDEAPFATALYVGEEFTIEIANDAMLSVWGKAQQVIGQPLAQALPELDGQPFLDLLRDVRTSGIAYSANEQSADLVVDGRLQRFWFNFTYKPLRDDGGQVYSVLNMAVDVTEQVMARQRLEETEAALRNAVNMAELGTWMIDLTEEKVFYDERVEEWFGLPPGSAMAKLFDVVPSADVEQLQVAIAAACAPGSDNILDVEHGVMSSLNGRRRIIHSKGVVQRNADGVALSITGTGQDVTAQKDLQLALETEVQTRTEELAASGEELQSTNEELAETNERLLRSNEELAQYAYVASHDLQEPLRKIQFFSTWLQDENSTPERQADALTRITNSTRRMSLLINDLLEFSRLLNSDALVRLVDLNEIVQNVVGDFELTISEKEARVTVGSLPMVEGVSLQLNQLFTNLIGNALKFSVNGKPPVIDITSRVASEEEIAAQIQKPVSGVQYHHITVSDNGIGFEPMYVNQIFEVFKRLHGKSEYSGSGIGLAICRRVANNHQGAIYAESALNQGATFHILLPQQQGAPLLVR